VLTVIGVPSATVWEQQREARFWEEMDKLTIQQCVDDEVLPNHPRAMDCARAAGAVKTFFDHENTTPARYWSTGLLMTFILDLVITGLIVAVALTIRWVVRGFRAPA
jgi:hypothetical protein